MTVDILSLAIVLLLAYLGWRSGAVRQIVRVIAVIAVVVGVPFVSPVIRQFIFGEPGWAKPGIEVASIVVAGIAIYLAVSLAGWLVVKTMRFVSMTLSLVDRAAGASIGAVKALLIVYLVAALVVMVEGPLAERDPDDRMALRGGILVTFAADYNVLAPWQFPDLETLHVALYVGELVDELQAHAMIREYPDAAEVLRHERVQQLISDEELMDWINADHYPLTLADHRVRRILNDEAVMERLEAVDWEALQQRLEDKEGS